METTAADARIAVVFAACAALAATLPLIGARTIPSPVRAALALVLAPLAALHIHVIGHTAMEIARGACGATIAGATIGLSAAIVASTAASIGSLFDVAIAASPVGIDMPSGENHGPFATLVPLGFGATMLSSGAFTWLVVSALMTLDHASAYGRDASFVTALGRLVYGWAIALAFPMIGAYGLSSLIAAASARAAPKINGMLLAPALSSAVALTLALAAVPVIFAAFHRLADLTARAGHAA